MIKIDEKDLEDMIFSSMKSEEGYKKLHNRGLYVYHYDHESVYRQFNLKDYGIADIVRIIYAGRGIHIEVIELKVTEFHIDHLIQLGRYMSAFRNIIGKAYKSLGYKTSISGKLIVAEYKSSNYNWLSPMLTDVSIYSTGYDIDGIKFNHEFPCNWQKTNTDHSLKNYFDMDECLLMHKKAYRECLASEALAKKNS